VSKKHRKIAPWLKDAERAVKNLTHNLDPAVLPHLGWSASAVFDQLVHQPDMTQKVLHLLNVVRNASGAGRRVIFERDVMRSLASTASDVCSMIYDESIFPKPLTTNLEAVPPDRRAEFAYLQTLCFFAMDCFRFSRPSDSFAGERRRLAFELMANASAVIEPPDELFDCLKKALKRARDQEVIGAILFCETYYARKEGFPEEMEQLLLGVVEKTKVRGIAGGALNVLIEANLIGEFGAMDRMDEWKVRNNYFSF
jgi:hypothetical protein